MTSDAKGLAGADERLRALVEGALDAVVEIDAEGRITQWNPQAEALFGWRRDEIVGRLLAETIIPERYREPHREGLARYRATGEGPLLNRRVEIEALHRDGKEFTVELTITPLGGKPAAYFSAFVRDISERRRLERQRRELFEMASHDLKTPLTVIRGRLQHARRMLAGQAADVDRHLDEAEHQVERMLALIGDLLDVSRFAIGDIPVRPELLDLRALVQDATERHDTGAGGAPLRASVPDQPVLASADRLRVEQVLDNLIANALRHSSGSRGVDVRLFSEGREALVRVRDDGVGISAEDRAWLFQPNFARSYGGTGLGLHISRRIAERHGGRLWLEETGPQGSTFTLALPLARPADG